VEKCTVPFGGKYSPVSPQKWKALPLKGYILVPLHFVCGKIVLLYLFCVCDTERGKEGRKVGGRKVRKI